MQLIAWNYVLNPSWSVAAGGRLAGWWILGKVPGLLSLR